MSFTGSQSTKAQATSRPTEGLAVAVRKPQVTEGGKPVETPEAPGKRLLQEVGSTSVLRFMLWCIGTVDNTNIVTYIT